MVIVCTFKNLELSVQLIVLYILIIHLLTKKEELLLQNLERFIIIFMYYHLAFILMITIKNAKDEMHNLKKYLTKVEQVKGQLSSLKEDFQKKRYEEIFTDILNQEHVTSAIKTQTIIIIKDNIMTLFMLWI